MTMPQAELRPALAELLFQLADDDLVASHRLAEWLGVAPRLEEDVALASIAQDETGHAALWYRLLHELGQADADTLAYGRPAAARRNAVLLEGPDSDWADLVVRHYAYSVFETERLRTAVLSSYAPLAQAAAKMLREETYHLLHFSTWFRRLGTAAGEARQRLAAACQRIWPLADGLFEAGLAAPLYGTPVWPAQLEAARQAWLAEIVPVCAGLELPLPGQAPGAAPNGRAGEHGADLAALLETMTEVYRLDPAAHW